jgi:hypothetical protein
MRGEHTIVFALEVLPLVAGFGQILEWRRTPSFGVYLASVIVPALMIASAFAK